MFRKFLAIGWGAAALVISKSTENLFCFRDDSNFVFHLVLLMPSSCVTNPAIRESMLPSYKIKQWKRIIKNTSTISPSTKTITLHDTSLPLLIERYCSETESDDNNRLCSKGVQRES